MTKLHKMFDVHDHGSVFSYDCELSARPRWHLWGIYSKWLAI